MDVVGKKPARSLLYWVGQGFNLVGVTGYRGEIGQCDGKNVEELKRLLAMFLSITRSKKRRQL